MTSTKEEAGASLPEALRSTRWKPIAYSLSDDVGAWSTEEAEALMGMSLLLEKDRITVGTHSCTGLTFDPPGDWSKPIEADPANPGMGPCRTGKPPLFGLVMSCEPFIRYPFIFVATDGEHLLAMVDDLALCLEKQR